MLLSLYSRVPLRGSAAIFAGDTCKAFSGIVPEFGGALGAVLPWVSHPLEARGHEPEEVAVSQAPH